MKDVKLRLYRTMLNQESGWFDTKGTGELINRLSNDTYIVSNSLSQNLSDGLRSSISILAGTSMMFYTSTELSLVSLAIVPCIGALAIVYGRYVKKITQQLLDQYAENMKTGEERLNNIKTVKMFCKEEHENRIFDNQLIDALALGYKDVKARATFYSLVSSIQQVYYKIILTIIIQQLGWILRKRNHHIGPILWWIISGHKYINYWCPYFIYIVCWFYINLIGWHW